MNAPNLPAHLANRQSRGIAQQASAGINSGLPPHVSIQGNTFTLIDAAGNEHAAGPILDCVVVGAREINCKRFYPPDKPYAADSNDAPLCWSANGVGPSSESVKPQARTCAECPNNERGSKMSVKGVAIKACRDEKWVSFFPVEFPGMLFRLTITPGSFKSWKAYCDQFQSRGMDLDFAVTRMSFVPKENGVLQFTDAGFTTPEQLAVVDKAVSEKVMLDTLLGRNDVPRDPALMAPQAQPVQQIAAPTQQVQQPGPLQTPSALNVAPNPAFGSNAASVATESPSEPQRRKRRTKAEIEADEAHATSQPPANSAVMAPFRPTPAPGFGASAPAVITNGPVVDSGMRPATEPQSQFGMQQGVAPNAELAGALKSVFGDK